MGMEKRSISAETPGRLREGMLSPGPSVQPGTVMPCPPHASPTGHRCSHCHFPSSPPAC